MVFINNFSETQKGHGFGFCFDYYAYKNAFQK